MKRMLLVTVLLAGLTACEAPKSGRLRLAVLDPGHFHAALLQKSPLAELSDTVRVYAPGGVEVEQYLRAVAACNERPEQPTAWVEQVCIGDDYLERMFADDAADVVVLAGNNRRKTEYLSQAVKHGIHVLADKPLAIDRRGFDLLEEAYGEAAARGCVICDLMTERYDLLNILTRELLGDREVFGELLAGTPEEPAVTMRSVHHFYKEVSGVPLVRPAWYYDVRQQGEGIADVTTHLIDLLFWQCFPGEAIRWQTDVELLSAAHAPTAISRGQYLRSTGEERIPDYLEPVRDGDTLRILANGSLCYAVRGVHVGMSVRWDFEAPAGGGDTFEALYRGSRAEIAVVQDAGTGFVKELFVRPADAADRSFDERLRAGVERLRRQWPFVGADPAGAAGCRIVVPQAERPGHEEHFSMVAERFFEAVRGGGLPEWERENTLSKYYITTGAVELAAQADRR